VLVLVARAEALGRGQVLIGDRALVVVEVARTDEERARGLSGREALPPDHGMLFVYQVPTRPTIWMQGMRFPLDILWIKGGRVVDFVLGANPPSRGEPPPIFVPRQEAEYVLEVPAGFVERLGVKRNDPVRILLE
jgi:uncharacterized membrane protein (UPF0127 family)